MSKNDGGNVPAFYINDTSGAGLGDISELDLGDISGVDISLPETPSTTLPPEYSDADAFSAAVLPPGICPTCGGSGRVD